MPSQKTYFNGLPPDGGRFDRPTPPYVTEGGRRYGRNKSRGKRKKGRWEKSSLRDRKSDRQSAKKTGMHATKARLT